MDPQGTVTQGFYTQAYPGDSPLETLHTLPQEEENKVPSSDEVARVKKHLETENNALRQQLSLARRENEQLRQLITPFVNQLMQNLVESLTTYTTFWSILAFY